MVLVWYLRSHVAPPKKKVTETSENSKEDSQRPLMDNKFRAHSFKSHWRGGWMSRGCMRGGWGMMKGFDPPGYERMRAKDGGMNGFAPRGMRRIQPYPDPRGHRGWGGPIGMCPPPPPLHFRGPFPHTHSDSVCRHGSHPSCHPGYRGCPPHPEGRGVSPRGPPRHFHPCSPRSYRIGPVSPPLHPPRGRGQRWPGPPGGRRL